MMQNRGELRLARDAVLYGAGGHARELRYELEEDGVNVQVFIDDFDPGRLVDGLPVISFAEAEGLFRGSDWFIAIV